jgi:hypothetical protein
MKVSQQHHNSFTPIFPQVLNDWIRGRLPYFECPPFDDGTTIPHGKTKMLGVEQMFKKISVSTPRPTEMDDIEAAITAVSNELVPD